jgi:EpsI family protein
MRQGAKRHAVVLWILAPILLLLSTYRPEGGDRGRARRVPLQLGGFAHSEEFPLTDSVIAMLGTPDAVWRRYTRAGAEVFVVAVFHDENWKSVHAPDTCLRGSNMDIVDEGTISVPRGDDAAPIQAGYLRMRVLDSGRDYLSLFVYVAASDFATGDYWSFFLHHAPRALLRQSVAGCLLRVETYVGDDGLDAAKARCAEVLSELVPASQALLR